MKISKHTIKYTKSSNFATIGVNGVYGGVTNSGNINMNFYSECAPIPDNVVLEFDEQTGAVQNEVFKIAGEVQSTRELCIGVNIDLDTAKSLSLWLNDKIKNLESPSDKDSL